MPVTKKVEVELQGWKTHHLVLAIVVNNRKTGITCTQIAREIERCVQQVHGVLGRLLDYNNVIRVPAQAVGEENGGNKKYYFPAKDGIRYLNYLFREEYDRPELQVDLSEAYKKSDFNIPSE